MHHHRTPAEPGIDPATLKVEAVIYATHKLWWDAQPTAAATRDRARKTARIFRLAADTLSTLSDRDRDLAGVDQENDERLRAELERRAQAADAVVAWLADLGPGAGTLGHRTGIEPRFAMGLRMFRHLRNAGQVVTRSTLTLAMLEVLEAAGDTNPEQGLEDVARLVLAARRGQSPP